jgi:hypothetical protein
MMRPVIPIQTALRGGADLCTVLSLLVSGAACYAAWLTSTVFSGVAGHYPLLVAAALFCPIGVVHGVGVWFGGW